MRAVLSRIAPSAYVVILRAPDRPRATDERSQILPRLAKPNGIVGGGTSPQTGRVYQVLKAVRSPEGSRSEKCARHWGLCGRCQGASDVHACIKNGLWRPPKRGVDWELSRLALSVLLPLPPFGTLGLICDGNRGLVGERARSVCGHGRGGLQAMPRNAYVHTQSPSLRDMMLPF